MPRSAREILARASAADALHLIRFVRRLSSCRILMRRRAAARAAAAAASRSSALDDDATRVPAPPPWMRQRVRRPAIARCFGATPTAAASILP
jgi:hypothetical protein